MSDKVSRRSFVNSLAMGSVALLVSPLLKSRLLAQSSIASKTNKKYGIALVGLGYYSTDLLAPALQETHNTRLAGIVTGTPEKEKIWSEKYKIPAKNIYNYNNFDKIADNPDIDIIYVVLPNDMHKEFTIRAAQAGKDVICEKPMAMNSGECKEMIEACKRNNVSLSIGYRLQYDPVTREIIRFHQEKVFGGIEYVTAHSGWRNNQPKSAWRLQKKHGGGVMMDMGPYSIQGARYSVGEEPLSVTAQEYKRNPQRFDEVDEIVTMQMEFPGGAVANLFTSFHTYTDLLHLRAEKGGFDLSPFWAYRNLKGKSTLGPIEFDQVNQQVLQMDEIAYRIENKMPMLTPGEEGLRDMIIIEGVFESIKTGKKILLNVS